MQGSAWVVGPGSAGRLKQEMARAGRWWRWGDQAFDGLVHALFGAAGAAAAVLDDAQAGAQVSAYEPFKPDFVTPHVRVTPTLSEAIENADALVLLVGHAQFKALDPQVVRAQTHADVVLDTVNGWNYDAWTAAGFKVVKLGKGQR